MESNMAFWGVLIFVLLIVGANFVMYAIVRGATRPGNNNVMDSLNKSLNTAVKKDNAPMQELHKRVQELEKSKKDKAGDSE